MADEGGQNGEARRDYATGLRSGIHDRKHFRAMGIALWTFDWCVDRQTDAAGWVLGGRVLTYQEIANGVGLETRKQAEHQIATLVTGGYLARLTVSGGGIRLRIRAPKKALRHHLPGGGAGTPEVPGERAGTRPVVGRGCPVVGQEVPGGGAPPYKDQTHLDSQETHHPLPPAMAPEDLYALARRHGLRLDVMNGAFTAGQNGHLFVDVLRLGATTLDSALAAIAHREKRYQPGSARSWIDALLAEAAKPPVKKCSVTDDDKWRKVAEQGWDYKP